MSDSSVPLKHDTRFLVVVLVLVALANIVTLQTSCENNRVAEGSTAAQRVEAFRQAHPPANLPAPPPPCPPFNGSTLLTSVPTKAEHRVILEWKASVQDDKHADAVGYCIYRWEKKSRQKKLINYRALPKTECTDDLVENDHKYIYVVRAVSQRGILSKDSNETHADIPKTEPKPHPEGWPQLCRADNPQ
jgi:fibronectin type 3 domain-containing protein